MRNDPAPLLLALQFGDSAFPSGGFAFSWGLEGLAADGLVETPEHVAEIIDQQLTLRWNTMDRVLFGRAFAAEGTLAAIDVDRLAEAATASAPMRRGSRRAGRALLGIGARLGQPDAAAYRDAADGDERLGHLAVMQAIVFRGAGLDFALAELVSGWTVITGLASAALRLGLLGHVEALAVTASARMRLAALLERPVAVEASVSAFTPLTDIAVTRNMRRETRLFAT